MPGQMGYAPGMQVQPMAVPMMAQPVFHQAQPAYQAVPQGYGVVPASFNSELGEDLGIAKGGKGKACGGKCGGKGCGECVTGGYVAHLNFYGEFLYLRMRDAEVAFAVPIDGPITPGTPRVEVGPVAVADMDFQPGGRFGAGFCINPCTQLSMQYTYFESGTTESTAVQAPYVIESLVQHPSVSNAGSNFLEAYGHYDVSFDLIDVAMTRLLSYSCTHQVGYVLGLRYAQHEQGFSADFAGSGTENVTTDIDFNGVGVRGGLEMEQYLGCHFLVYAKGYGSILPGEFRASYLQGQSFDNRVVNTSWKAGRVMTMWDLELGLGWTSKCNHYRATAGYVFSAWTNMVQTDEWIRGVHTNDFIDMDDQSTFDGLVARFEARY